MSSEITEDNAQGGLALPSHNECSNAQQITLNTMDISDSQNLTFKETLPSGEIAESENSRKAGLANVNKDDIPLKNKKTKVVGDACLDENLIAKARELDISQNKSTDVEPTKSQGTSAQVQLSLSFRDLLKLSSELSDSSGNEDNTNVKIKTIGFRGKEVDDDEFMDSELDSESEGDDYAFVEEKQISSSVQNMNIKKKIVQEQSWLSALAADQLYGEVPDISTLGLNNKEEFIHMGNVECIINKIVTIAGLPDMPAFDLDTLLFLEEGQKVLGYVFDAMGPVSNHVYIVHMSSTEAIKNLQLHKGTKVYCAPKTKYTKYIFLPEFMKLRGSDAAWTGDVELPSELQDFSDEERESKTKVPKTGRKRCHSQERYRKFVEDMNRANERDTRLHRMADTHRLQLDRLLGIKGVSIGQYFRESRLRNQRSGITNQSSEGRRSRPHFRNSNSVDSELQDWSSTAVDNGLPPLPSLNTSILPTNSRDSGRFLLTTEVSALPPLVTKILGVSPQDGADPSRSTNRSNFRQNSMPGPSSEGWFN